MATMMNFPRVLKIVRNPDISNGYTIVRKQGKIIKEGVLTYAEMNALMGDFDELEMSKEYGDKLEAGMLRAGLINPPVN